MDKNISLEYKIQLWNKLTDLLNDKKNTFQKECNIFVGIGLILSVINAIFNHSNNDTIHKLINLTCLAGPAIIIAFLFWFSIHNKTVAIIEGHLSAIEDLINKEMGECVYQTNSYYHWMYSKATFPSNNILSVFYIAIIIILTVTCDVYIYQHLIISVWAELIYIFVFLFFLIILLKDLLTNPAMRKLARAYYHDNYTSKKSTEYYKNPTNEELLINYLTYIPNIMHIQKKYGVNNE